ncbi:hypothetical protein PQX77_013149 [Marasmius sp. AFHP31]|nr:hypothetical protein PQX77_013149 [Marasmius sp. AFHP31]
MNDQPSPHDPGTSSAHIQQNLSAEKQNVNFGRDQNVVNVEKVDVGPVLLKNYLGSKKHQSLWEAVADIGASHTAEQQYDRGACLPGTRRTVLGTIEEWRSGKKRDRPICWLSGTAGVGKTAIAMTVAKNCHQDGLVSSFFFFRTDPRRNNPSALMLTIAYGLTVVNISSCHDTINRRISRDPTILDAQIEEQLQELILQPLRQQKWWKRAGLRLVPHSRAQRRPNLVIIDGLDECSDEESQVRVLNAILSAFQSTPGFPLRFLICSRPESWIREVFDDPLVCQFSKVIVLEDDLRSDDDIMQYFQRKFEEISTSPKYRDVQFSSPWPSKEVVVSLVFRASGQFIYAKTIIGFLKLGDSHPLRQLDIILNKTLQHHQARSPYHELDCLYTVILTANREPEKVLPILAAIHILPSPITPTPECLELLLGWLPGEVNLSLRAMHSVLDVRGWQDPIRVHHKSFTDHLSDSNRSGSFFIGQPAQRQVLSRLWLQALSTQRVSKYKSVISLNNSGGLSSSVHFSQF